MISNTDYTQFSELEPGNTPFTTLHPDLDNQLLSVIMVLLQLLVFRFHEQKLVWFFMNLVAYGNLEIQLSIIRPLLFLDLA